MGCRPPCYMTDSHDTEPLKAGALFGDYVVERKLGSGAMGAVYLVRAPDDSLFAVKIMFPGKMTHDLRRRFAHEADFAMKIRHRNLISVYDVGEDPETGLCYIIMDYVSGGTLSDRIKAQGRIPVDEAVKIVLQIAVGLDVAHKNGLVHRDVKPDNIMFDADGTPKLADLGVAKFDDDRKTMVTMTGMVIGTPAYMSPEQLMDSHRIDARADIYSLGIVLYEMLAGTRPNSNSTAVELLAKAIKGEKLPDIRKMCPEISAAVAYVLSLMCAPKPDERPATSIEAAKLLHKAVTGRLVLPKKPPRAIDAAARRKKRPFPVWTSCILGVLAIGSMLFGWWGLQRKSTTVHSVITVTNKVERMTVVTNNVVQHVVPAVRTEPNAPTRSDTPVPSSAPPVSSANRTGKLSLFEQRPRYHGETPAPGWIMKRPGEMIDITMTCESVTTGDGMVDRVLCTYFPQSNQYQTVRWYGDIPTERFETLSETGDIYIRIADKGRHLADVDLTCDFNVVCNKVEIDFSKIDGTTPYDRSTFEYRTFTRDWRSVDTKRVHISLTHPWIIARRDEILAAVGNDHIDYAYRAYVLVASQFSLSRANADISQTIERKRGDDMSLSAIFVSLLRAAGIPARTLCGKRHTGQLHVCPEFYIEGCGWIPANIVRDVGRGKDVHHFGVYDETCVIVASDCDVTVQAARNTPCHLDRFWFVWWWLFSGPWTPCDTRFDWKGALTTEQAVERKLASGMENRQKTVPKAANKKPSTTVLFTRLDRSPAAWAYSFTEEKGWRKPEFNDSKWKRASGGFGMREDPRQLWHARLNTNWQTKQLFVRRHFNWSGGDVTRVVADLYHDDDVSLYLNGRLMLTVNGANFDWQPFEIPACRFAKALKEGDNILCAEVRNDRHCQYFDCGLLVECGGDVVTHAGPDRVRQVKTSAGTWTVMVIDGVAQIGDGINVALEPRPKGTLEIPSELDGLPIRKLARDCFKDCGEIERVIIPNGICSVGQGAFFNCPRLADVSVPDSLEHFGIESLHGANLKRIDLRNVRLFEAGVFKFCSKLDKVSVASGNLTYRVRDGVLYDEVRKAVAFCPRSRKTFAFPSGIEEIYDSAFQRGRVKSVVIPETVEIVGNCAFNECPFLEKVKFLGKDAILGAWSFGNTPSLKSVTLPSRLKTLDDWAIFNNAGKLESMVLPDTVEVIGDAVFESCRKLKRISLGKSLRRAGHHAFAGCQQLQSIEFPNTLQELGTEVFLNCTSLKTVLFMGNAPDLQDQGVERFGKDLYRDTPSSLVTHVLKGSTGWQDADPSNLPGRWPVDGGESARPIKYSPNRSFTKGK